MATVLPIDPMHPKLGLVAPLFAQRVLAFADQYQPEINSVEFTRALMAKLYLGDPNILALGIIEEDSATLVGHALATLDMFGTARWVTISQVRADENVGDARVKAVEDILEWAQARGVTKVILHTNRDGKDWEKRLGFKPYRHMLRVSLDPPSQSPA